MISRFFLILYFSFYLISCNFHTSENQITSTPNDLPELVHSYSTQNAGSAMFLSGKIHNLVIFITENEFPNELQEEQLSYIYEAQEFLKKEAKRYGKKVEFTNSFIGYPEDPVILDKIEQGEGRGDERVDWVSFLLEKFYTTPIELYKDLKKEYHADHVLVTIVANKPGRGYAFAYEPHLDKNKYFLEGVMQYVSYPNNQKNCAASYAHEFLHLFGAWDLYQTFEITSEQEKKAKFLYPDDIMLATSYDINTKKIDSLTAYLVGLHVNYNPIFDEFEPKR